MGLDATEKYIYSQSPLFYSECWVKTVLIFKCSRLVVKPLGVNG